jgi:hypothetical protein
MRLLLLGIAACGLLTATASAQSAQPAITFISSGRAEAVTQDGRFAVGRDFGGSAFRWDRTTGVTSLLTGGNDDAVDVSADGQTVFGSSGTTPAQHAIWTGSSWTDLGEIPGSLGCPDLASPYAISDDGLTATGLGWDNCNAVALKWTQSGGNIALNQIGPFSARGNAISGDGLFIGGWDEASNGTRRAALWRPNGTERLLLVNTPGNAIGAGEVWGISSNGGYVVGNAAVGAFRWNGATGAQNIGAPAGAGSPTTAMGVSDDGTIVVGTAGSFFSGLKAFIWIEGSGMMLLDDYVTNVLGLTLPAGQSLQGATDITPDGRTIVGYIGSNSFQTDAFVLDLPLSCGWSNYGNGAGAANILDVTGGGSASLGGVFQITTTGITGSVSVTAIGFAASSFPALGGTGLIDVFQFYGYFVNPATAGTSTMNLALPTNPTLAGLEVFFQTFAPDASQIEGWALSNGLKLEVCP